MTQKKTRGSFMTVTLKTGAALTAAMAAFTLGACDNGGNNPLTNPAPDTPATESPLPPGTDDPSAGGSINRYEEEDGSGNGYAQSITYNEVDDTFTVDNLGFDGTNTYSRVTLPDAQLAAAVSPYRVYENASTFADSVTGTPITQLPHKAILGVSTNSNPDGSPVTQFALVRTGAYTDYGFGGFMYERNGAVVLPTSGQAGFRGGYAGLRDFRGVSGMEYTTGDMTLDIDFDDFNAGDAVKGTITNRQVYDMDGNRLTDQYIAEINDDNALVTGWQDIPLGALPSLHLTIGPDTLNADGELTNGITSSNSGVQLESGNYYAVLAGEGADMEVTGIVVIESADPGTDGVVIRETGGFILYR
ncbi:hypothetical protein [Aliiroseovarius crassostreae]|uniref:hypothetical protein n=1 Tax=Aliiroseovarius crassostreae TaxID=154981 RepID=UPI00220EE9DA|nr:hypothetical protein [Aliiroseovarius crassostreae]UWQ08868.1 hypothetical protein K3X25_04620 [Aliiroseovarius crassostreae]